MAKQTGERHGTADAEEEEKALRYDAAELRPGLRIMAPGARTTSVVLLIHGGRAKSREPVSRGSLPLARMRMFAPAILGAARGQGTSVALLRDRYRGWNEPHADPVEDAGWALEEIERRFGAVPVVLVGHSMGGRAALRVAGHPAVRGVAALAPWVPNREPVAQLAGRTVLVAHGDRDAMTSPADSLAYVRRAAGVADRICFWQVRGARHAMLERPGYWHGLVRDFALGVLGIRPMTQDLADALDAGALDLGVRGANGRRHVSRRR
ncbi:alpha/beta hydrolase [Actinocrinis sp.]|uniref:alpha/beta hydrolase n=1 Tax=Actinocrinis sp. TaxID=1920516 RepID=UPI002D4718BD|nr:alpha/beta fold hydrolase [Actinocrinis sp.]HZP51773.1 alpha/beta fold hydrolase [Actinocrinis sp.]